MTEVDRIAGVLADRFAITAVNRKYGWGVPSLNVLDCVLSLNRRYDGFVVPRVRAFSERHPNVLTLRRLGQLIRHYRSPLEFSVAELQYRDTARATTLLGVIDYLLSVQRLHAGPTETAPLARWARSVQPSDCRTVGVRGFGLAGFQYLRMLFGVQTAKPDVHIRRFVSGLIGRPVTDLDALVLLELAARHAKVPLREADYEIWRQLSNRGAGVG